MNITFTLGALGSFLGGVALGLLLSYPIEAKSLIVCFWALYLLIAAALIGAVAIVFHATRSERVRAERVVDLTAEALLRRRGLEAVDD
jgi:hypothetical protein